MAENPTTVSDEQARLPAPPGMPPVLDEAHIGDIRGALGTIRMDDTSARHDWRSRLMALLAIMGPGLIVMVGDNDAGGVSTYAQAGQNYGTTLLWTLILLIPVLIVNQEMVIRLGAVTGVGHARLINERFGRFWGWFSVGDLFVLNFLTIVTEFIGVSLALGYFGISRYVAVPLAAAALVGITSTGSFRSWERFMYVFVVANFLVIPLLFMVHPSVGTIAHDTFLPSIRGGGELDGGTADHRDRRHDGRAVAAVLPAVEHHRQADHAALDQLRARGHRDRRVRGRDRRGRDDVGRGLRARRHAAGRSLLKRGRGRERAAPLCRPGRGRVLRDRAAQRLDDRRRVGDACDLLRIRGRVRRKPLAAPRDQGRQALLRHVHRDGRGGGRHRAAAPARRSA